MSTPIIDADLWIEKADLTEINQAISHIVERIESGQEAIDFIRPPLIGSAKLRAGDSNAISSARDIRGETNGEKGNLSVSLSNFPRYPDQYQSLAGDIPGLKAALRPLFAHEAAHVRQLDRGDASMPAARDVAAAASKKAARTKLYADYVAYVAEEIEIAAHATQLAVEVMTGTRPISTSEEFESAASGTWLWSHMSQNVSCLPISDEDRAKLFNTIKDDLKSNGWWAYRRLT